MIDPHLEYDSKWSGSPEWQTRTHLEFFLKIQHVYGQKMNDWSPPKDVWPPSMTNQDLHLEFFLKIQHVYGQKDDWSPSNDRPGISPPMNFF